MINKTYKNSLLKTVMVLVGILQLDCLLAQNVYTVTKITDPDPIVDIYDFNDASCDPDMFGTLQWAIRKAIDPATSGTSTINFNISGTGSNIIQLHYQLPSITKHVIIDGTTQAGYQTGQPNIIIDGSLVPMALYPLGFKFDAISNGKILGLYVRNFYKAIVLNNSNSCEITNNVINQNSEQNITLHMSNNCIIRGNYVNTDISLTHFSINSEEGIFLTNNNVGGSSNNIIGGAQCGEGNTIAYTTSEGIDNDPTNSNPSNNINNLFSGNIIFGNTFDAIELRNAANGNKSAPTIITAGCTTSGTSEPNDIIELFGSSGPGSALKNANQFMKTIVADALGDWTADFDLIQYPFITATAHNSLNNTSELSPAISITPSVLDFSFPSNLCLASSITFNNVSTSCSGNITYKWDFGDGSALSTSSTHTYTSLGTYNVTLFMYPPIYCNPYSVTKSITITTCCPTCSNIQFGIMQGQGKEICAGNPVVFKNTSLECTGSPNYQWDFGDGTTATGLIIAHTYTSAGTYSVTLSIIGVGECPTSSVTNIVTITNCTSLGCDDCIGSFAPIEGEYLVSTWVKQANGENLTTYANAGVTIKFVESSMVYGPFFPDPTSKIIDGWQRIDSKFSVPAGATKILIELVNTWTSDVFFDDIRIHPLNSNMKSYVYDPITLRLVAELDENNYATFYEYDEDGALIRVKKETERGVVTIKETRNNNKK
ncbi:MAG: hypothetical protein A3F72_01640 [Bacteroidetes bacterium RIFCSPLOWO2_12_FULL_35_15]|nr:MAG: hypothetical protein A3F72_01640 [Bacteroidetes bacterium RIFCSPLOWO2_12_FULL_35_15]